MFLCMCVCVCVVSVHVCLCAQSHWGGGSFLWYSMFWHVHDSSHLLSYQLGCQGWLKNCSLNLLTHFPESMKQKVSFKSWRKFVIIIQIVPCICKCIAKDSWYCMTSRPMYIMHCHEELLYSDTTCMCCYSGHLINTLGFILFFSAQFMKSCFE